MKKMINNKQKIFHKLKLDSDITPVPVPAVVSSLAFLPPLAASFTVSVSGPRFTALEGATTSAALSSVVSEAPALASRETGVFSIFSAGWGFESGTVSS
jgi:hypothetical protein